MTGYSAVGRLGTVAVHRATEPSVPTSTQLRVETDVEIQDLAGEPLSARLEELWTSLREQWAMTTWYLFDAEGWR